MKIRQVLRLRNDSGELAQRLRHQPRLQTHLRIAHIAFEFGLGHERGHRVHHDDVHGVRTDQLLRDFERLFAIVRLRNEKIVDIHAQLARVDGIERVLGVDERRLAAELLRLGDHVQSESRLAARFRAVHFDDASARKTADAESRVDGDRAGGDHADRDEHVAVPQTHDRAFAVRLFNLRDCQIQIFSFFVVHFAPREGFRLGPAAAGGPILPECPQPRPVLLSGRAY